MKICIRLIEIILHGWVDHLHVHHYYWLADVFALASYVTFNPVTRIRDAETMGRVLCEANAAGLPVVASRSGGIPSVIQHEKNGLLFEPENQEDLLRQLQALHQSSSLRHALIQNGLGMARQQFDWAVVMEKHVELFNDLLNGSNQETRIKKC